MPESQDPQDPRPEQDPEHEGRIVPADDSGAVIEADSSPQPVTTAVQTTPPVPPPPASVPEPEPEDEDDEGMLRMSFLEHLEELRVRIIRALLGVAVAFAACLFFTDELWTAVMKPAAAALQQLGFPPDLAQISPTEAFSIIWVRLPVLCALFLASPWVLYQTWAFIAPGLYKKERRLALPFIFSTAGLFIAGGAFAYFVAFRFGLVFLLGIGVGKGVRPLISLTEYFDLFVNVILGVALVFELPVLIFFLTLLRIASPRFLLRHSRYAILGIVILAAIITPTPDVYNLMIFVVPMILLYFVGVYASYLLVLSREGKSVFWAVTLALMALAIALGGIAVWVMVSRFGYHLQMAWPLLVK